MMKEIDDLFFQFGSKDLYVNYAIERLGWIKIGTSVWHTVTYAGFDWQRQFIEPYIEGGYGLSNKYISSANYLKIDCNILRAIREG